VNPHVEPKATKRKKGKRKKRKRKKRRWCTPSRYNHKVAKAQRKTSKST
jgi:hypothetical protein